MDEMNPFEKQLQSWKPRRPSPEIARRLFGAARQAARWPRRPDTWSLLTPLAACALTLLVAVHTASPPAQLDSTNDAAFVSTLMVDAATSSNAPTYSLSGMDENLEWNIWPHALRTIQASPRAENRSLKIWSLVPTNR
jgi:hypothetical protein